MPQRFDEFKAENDVGADDDTTLGSIVSCKKFANRSFSFKIDTSSYEKLRIVIFSYKNHQPSKLPIRRQ